MMKKLSLVLWGIFIGFMLAYVPSGWGATETFYVVNGGDGSAPETLGGAWDESDLNTASNWDSDDQNDGKIGPNDLVLFYDNGGQMTTRVIIQQSGLSGKVIEFKNGTGETPILNSSSTDSLYYNAKHHLKFTGLTFYGGTTYSVQGDGTSYDIEFEQCNFYFPPDTYIFYHHIADGENAYNYVFDRCDFQGGVGYGEEYSECINFCLAGTTNNPRDSGTAYNILVDACTADYVRMFFRLRRHDGSTAGRRLGWPSGTDIRPKGIMPYGIMIEDNVVNDTQVAALMVQTGIIHKSGYSSYIKRNYFKDVGDIYHLSTNAFQLNYIEGSPSQRFVISGNTIDGVETSQEAYDGHGIILDFGWMDANIINGTTDDRYICSYIDVHHNWVNNADDINHSSGIYTLHAANCRVWGNVVTGCSDGLRHKRWYSVNLKNISMFRTAWLWFSRSYGGQEET